MMQYSILDRRPEEIFPLLSEHSISVVTRGSLARGLLSERYLEKISERGYLDYNFEELNSVLPSLKEKIASFRSFTEIALQFNLSNPAVATVVTGASNVEQIRANVKAVKSQQLSEKELLFIKELTKKSIYKEHR